MKDAAQLRLLLALLAMASLNAQAGADNAGLRCVGSGERKGLVLEGTVPIDIAEFELALTEAGHSSTWNGTQPATVVADFDRAVIVVGAAAPAGELLLYADPPTIRLARASGRERHATFDAFLSAPKPGTERADASGHYRSLRVRCAYDFAP